MGLHLNKYITTTVDITHTATTIDIMRIEFIVTVIGIIIEIGRDKAAAGATLEGPPPLG